MADARWLDEREDRVWLAYRDLRRELQAAFDRQLVRDAGLSAAEHALLVPLSEAPDGVLRTRELGRAVGWERSRLSHQVNRMEKRGLVVREECPDDARGSMVRLTPAGRTAIESAAPGHVAVVRRYFFDPLSAEELDVLESVFTRMLARIGNDRTGPAIDSGQ